MNERKSIIGELYHIYNRGTDKRKIFLDKNDYFRFIHDLFEFNDEEPSFNAGYYSIDVRRQYIEKKPRKLLVEILAFCLMPNHYHLLLRPRKNGAIAEFMKKINGGYAKYFNIKYQRTGVLFQGKYKLVLVKNESHFIHLPYYIHCNPLDLIKSKWRSKEIKNLNETINYLRNYRWSSYLDYIGKKNFPSVTQREFLLKYFGGEKQYEKETIQWLKEMDITEFKNVALESVDSY